MPIFLGSHNLVGGFIMLPSTQFVYDTDTLHVSLTTCFGLMGPSSGTFGFLQSPFPSATLPTLASIHTLGVRGMYGLCLPFLL
jgi:hypothetical protein